MSGPGKGEVVRPLGPWLRGRDIYGVLKQALANIVLAIPSLGVGISGQDTPKPQFVQQASINLEDHFEFLERKCEDLATHDAILIGILQDRHDRSWPNVEHQPPWKLTVVAWGALGGEVDMFVFDAVFAAHHSIADGRSTALFHKAFLGELNRPNGQPAPLSGNTLNLKEVAPQAHSRPQEELVRFSTSWGFIVRTLWHELAPAWLQGRQPPAPWAGKTITLNPCRTRLQIVRVPSTAVPNILAACRARQTTLTPFLHAMILASLSKQLPPEKAAAFRSTTPIDLRPFIDESSSNGRSLNLFGVFVTGQTHTFDAPTIAALRQGPSTDKIWEVAVGLRRSMKQHLDNVPKDDIMSILGWVPNWRDFWLSKVGRARQNTWEVSNIGSLPGCQEAEDEAGWKIQRSFMSQSAAVAGAAPLSVSNVGASALSMVQVRTKSNRMRPRDQGVVVRLLEDIPRFGRKDAVFRIERGRMRNQWFPHKRAEYMTPARFRELGLTRDDIGERDALYGTMEAAEFEESSEVDTPSATVLTTPPEKAHTILTTLIPSTLAFHRKPIPAPAPPPPSQSISPLVASAKADAAYDRDAPVAIYGSVSATDVVSHIKGLLVNDVEGSRIALGPEDVRFLGLDEETDRIKTLGRWEVDISVGGTGLEPVRKVVEILPLAEGSDGGEAQPTS
ncbi:alcohol acetyltransferase-domain-containing protein [Corynascus novoguineensis]|uniref:Alcohol acetyltransferase-domain-containing protein n=1 Tax=Corynascus novoguineensis TaxID=1126955 RepID=A0AAN7CP29_9PEZI|nr:alcohol acetyltransferase-domain-containing protein [Corynascus novoguineensis]